MNRDLLSTIGVVVLAACALVLTALTIRREVAGVRRGPTPVQRVSNWKSYSGAGHRIGPETAAVTAIVFSDYQCSACRRFNDSVADLLERRTDLAVVFRHYPLPGNPFAERAARASECAAFQGKFDPYHNLLFEKQDSLGLMTWARLAWDVGIRDTSAFTACVVGDSSSRIVASDVAAAKALGAVVTPTILVNDILYGGVPQNFETVVASQASAAAGSSQR